MGFVCYVGGGEEERAFFSAGEGKSVVVKIKGREGSSPALGRGECGLRATDIGIILMMVGVQGARVFKGATCTPSERR